MRLPLSLWDSGRIERHCPQAQVSHFISSISSGVDLASWPNPRPIDRSLAVVACSINENRSNDKGSRAVDRVGVRLAPSHCKLMAGLRVERMRLGFFRAMINKFTLRCRPRESTFICPVGIPHAGRASPLIFFSVVPKRYQMLPTEASRGRENERAPRWKLSQRKSLLDSSSRSRRGKRG